MTLTTKNSPEVNGPGKPGATSQNSENKSGQSPRSNPVCLEVGITIRSLPGEAGAQTQPIREEGRTVIVFDNGAVLRTTNTMPLGQTVIVSNPNGRDVVCKVVGGRNLPSVKGYAEVEFLEPVNDFWGIHNNAAPVAVAAPPVMASAPQEVPPPPPALTVSSPDAAASLASPGKSANARGNAPTFDDIGGLTSTPVSPAARESRTESARASRESINREAPNYNSELARPTSIANWQPPGPESAVEKQAIPALRDALSNHLPNSAPTRDFMSKGLMAYEQADSSDGASNSRTPMIVGVAALALAAICGAVFYMRRSNDSASLAKSAIAGQPSLPAQTASNSAPPAAEPPLDVAVQAAADAATQSRPQPQPVTVEQPPPAAAVEAPVPAVAKAPVSDSRPEPKASKRQEKIVVPAKQPEPSSPRRPAIANLKMSSPSAPNQSLANSSDGSAPLTEIASVGTTDSTTPAGLLTSSGRTSRPPTPPPPAFATAVTAPVGAPKTIRDPKLLSTTKLVYPLTAKQSNVQGNVTVLANIDENGNVVSAKAMNGPLLLRQAAVDSVKQWKYSPGTSDGKPVASQVTVGVDFKLN